jgi:hypothetical protein
VTVPNCPDPANHYVTEVNKGSINMRAWQGHSSDRYARGWRLHQVFEQDGNTVQVFVHHWHPDGYRAE